MGWFGRRQRRRAGAGAIVALDSAILSERDFDALRVDRRLVQHELPLALGSASLRARVHALAGEAERAVRGGASLIVLDDRPDEPSVPALLAAGAVHQRLVARGLRMQASLAVADGYARDAHAVAAVIAAGANVVTPWLGLRLASELGDGTAYLRALRARPAEDLGQTGHLHAALLRRRADLRIVGLCTRDVVEACFPGMRAHVPTLRFDDLEADVRIWFEDSRTPEKPLPDRGSFRFRREGVRHAFDPDVDQNSARDRPARRLRSVRTALRCDGGCASPSRCAICLQPLALRDPMPLESVEPPSRSFRRFATAAMSLGALSPEVHAAIAIARQPRRRAKQLR